MVGFTGKVRYFKALSLSKALMKSAGLAVGDRATVEIERA